MRLQERFEKSGMSIYALAQKARLPYMTVNDLFNGKTRLENSKASTLARLAKVLETTMEELLENEARYTQKSNK